MQNEKGITLLLATSVVCTVVQSLGSAWGRDGNLMELEKTSLSNLIMAVCCFNDGGDKS